MMNTVTVPATAVKGSGPSASGEAGTSGNGFLDTLARRVGDATGQRIRPETLAAWLEGETPDGLPADTTLAQLVGEILAGGEIAGHPTSSLVAEVEAEADTEQPVDVAGLLGMLAVLTRGADGASGRDEPADELMGRLRERGGPAARQLLDGLRGGGETLSGRFEQLVQMVSAAMDPAHAPRSGVEVPTLRVATPVHSPAFGQAVGERVVWMVRNDVQQARIQLNPPGLGPLEVTLSVQDDRATVALTAHHAITREAMNADAARLRAMLVDQGFTSVDVDVSRDSGAGASGGRNESESGAPADARVGDSGVAMPEQAAPVRAGRGLVDQYV